MTELANGVRVPCIVKGFVGHAIVEIHHQGKLLVRHKNQLWKHAGVAPEDLEGLPSSREQGVPASYTTSGFHGPTASASKGSRLSPGSAQVEAGTRSSSGSARALRAPAIGDSPETSISEGEALSVPPTQDVSTRMVPRVRLLPRECKANINYRVMASGGL